MSVSISTERLPPNVALLLSIISVGFGVYTAAYLGAGRIMAVVATAVLMVVLAAAYNFASS